MQDESPSSVKTIIYSTMRFLGEYTRIIENALKLNSENVNHCQPKNTSPCPSQITVPCPPQEIVPCHPESNEGPQPDNMPLTISEKEEHIRAKVYTHDFSSSVKSTRLLALGQIKKLTSPLAQDILKKLLFQETDTIKQIELLGALATCGGKVEGDRRFLRDYLFHSQAQIRLSALRVISKFEDEESFEILSMAVKDTQADIRKEALNFMCRSFGNRAIPSMLRLLHDLNDMVRQSAISMCSTFGCQQAVPALIVMLTDENKAIQKDVSAALQKITKHKEESPQAWKDWWMEQYVKS